MLITKSVGYIVLGIGKYQVDGVVVEVVQSVVIVGACNDNKTDLIGKTIRSRYFAGFAAAKISAARF